MVTSVVVSAKNEEVCPLAMISALACSLLQHSAADDDGHPMMVNRRARVECIDDSSGF